MCDPAMIPTKPATVKLCKQFFWTFVFRALKLTASVAVFVYSVFPATAEEPVDKFLEALSERGYYDVALDYLDSLETSDRVSDKIRKRLSFEKAQLLIDQASTLRNSRDVDEKLNEAQDLLDRFANKADTPELQVRVLQFRGNLLLSRARISDYQANDDKTSADEKNRLNEKTRSLLAESEENYRGAREQLRSVLKNFQIDPEDPSSSETLRKLRADYTMVRVRVPMVQEQLADSYPADDPKRASLLKQAAEEAEKLFEQYRKYQAGLEACLVAARCRQKLGQHNEAVAVLQDIFDLKRDAAFRSVKRRAYAIAVDSWRQIEPYPWQEITNRLQKTVELLNQEEALTPDWLNVQLELARALQAKSEYVKQQEGPTASRDAKDLARSAAKLARNVSKVPGDFRDQAVKLLDSLNVDIDAETLEEPQEAPPENFAEALARARSILPEVDLLVQEASAKRREAKQAVSADEKSSANQVVKELRGRIVTKTDKALELFDAAVARSDAETPADDVVTARYLQSYCYYARRQYLEASIIADFLVERFPNFKSSQQAAALLINSYSRILQQVDSNAGEDSFERRQLAQACQRLVEIWPDSDQAALGAGTLARLSLVDQDYAAAEKWYQKIPANNPGRTDLAVSLGRGLWFDYLKARKANEATDAENADQQLQQAKQFLNEGVSNAGIGGITYDVALGALLLVDAHLESGDVDKAVDQLESDAVGPLKLVKQKHPAIEGNSRADLFRSQTYKTAIKTYLAAMRNGGAADQQKWIGRASEVIEAMKSSMSSQGDAGGRQQLAEIYRLMASELRQQFDQLTSPAARASFAESLGAFLGAIEKSSQDARTLLWSGSTLLGVAEQLAGDGGAEQATTLFDQAVSALNRAEEIGFGQDEQATALVRELKRQRALAQRGAGKFDDAVAQLAELLKLNPNDLTAQLDAAQTLQMKAEAQKQSRAYAAAMMGAEPFVDPETNRKANAIWGWRRLVQATRRNDKFKQAFYRSLYYLVEARYEYGVLENSDKAMASARSELENAMQRDPEFGGTEWKPKFEALKERIK